MPFEIGFDPDEEAASAAVIRAVAAVQGTPPRDVQPPLYESVDPGALDVLFERGRQSGTEIAFTHASYRIRVGDDGRIVVGEPGETPPT